MQQPDINTSSQQRRGVARAERPANDQHTVYIIAAHTRPAPPYQYQFSERRRAAKVVCVTTVVKTRILRYKPELSVDCFSRAIFAGSGRGFVPNVLNAPEVSTL